MKLKIKAVSPKIGAEIPFPYYASAGAAAMDLHACLEEPALVFARSGLGIRHGVALSNGVGVIDSDYRGEIAVGLHNSADAPYTVQPGDRIAQLAVVPVVRAELEQTDELDETGRGVGGFGSTGK